MNVAKNHLKMASHNQNQIHARIIKLQKEEEKANKRIRDANRKAEFIENIHKIKNEKMEMKNSHYNNLKMMEETNRARFNYHRSQTRQNIN